MKRIIEAFKKIQSTDEDRKTAIISRLFEKSHISTDEAVLLCKNMTININTESLEMSSGAKIVGGSDFESTRYPGR